MPPTSAIAGQKNKNPNFLFVYWLLLRLKILWWTFVHILYFNSFIGSDFECVCHFIYLMIKKLN